MSTQSVCLAPSLFPSLRSVFQYLLAAEWKQGSWHHCVIYVILLTASGPCVFLPCSGSADTVTQGRVSHAHKLAVMRAHTHALLGELSRWRGRVTSARQKMNWNETSCCPCWHLSAYTKCDMWRGTSVLSPRLHFPLHIVFHDTCTGAFYLAVIAIAYNQLHSLSTIFGIWEYQWEKFSIPCCDKCTAVSFSLDSTTPSLSVWRLINRFVLLINQGSSKQP